MSGTARVGQKVRVLGEGYSPLDEEDMSEQVITNLWIFEARWAGITIFYHFSSLLSFGAVLVSWQFFPSLLLATRYRVDISTASAGSWVLIGGVDSSIMKTATIVESLQSDEDVYICRPLTFSTKSVVKVSFSFPVLTTSRDPQNKNFKKKQK